MKGRLCPSSTYIESYGASNLIYHTSRKADGIAASRTRNRVSGQDLPIETMQRNTRKLLSSNGLFMIRSSSAATCTHASTPPLPAQKKVAQGWVRPSPSTTTRQKLQETPKEEEEEGWTIALVVQGRMHVDMRCWWWTTRPISPRWETNVKWTRLCTRGTKERTKDGRKRRTTRVHVVPSEAQTDEANTCKWNTWWTYTRPHTMLGTAVSVASVSCMAAGEAVVHAKEAFAIKLVQAMASALLMNVAIVGINQVHDVDVDKINKPYLPLASGAMDVQEGKQIASTCAVGSLLIGACPWSTPLMITLVGSLALGLLYSVDLKGMRWKKHPALAATCIFAVRAVLVQLGFSLHAQLATGQAMQITRPIAATMGLMAVFSLVIAFFKDIPDVHGDEKNTIHTLSVRLGPRTVFYLCMGLLTAIYAGAIGYSALACKGSFRLASSAAHLLFLAMLWIRSKEVVLDSSPSLYSFYMFIWKLFYAEYLVLPFLR